MCRAIPHPAESPYQEARPPLEGAAQPLLTLEAAAGDLDAAVRRRALEALVRAHPDAGGGPWGPRAIHDPSPWVQRGAIEALGRRGDDSSLALVAQLAERDSATPAVRCAAAEAMAQGGDARGLEIARELYVDEPESFLAAPCALAAARLGDADAVGVLEAAIAEGELPIELPFYRDLASSGLTQLAEPLATAAGEVDEAIVVSVAGAAFALDPDVGGSALRKVLNDGTPGQPARKRHALRVSFTASSTWSPASPLSSIGSSPKGTESARRWSGPERVGRSRGTRSKRQAA